MKHFRANTSLVVFFGRGKGCGRGGGQGRGIRVKVEGGGGVLSIMCL